ncbi:MAG TPA: acylphosphatase [Burkholderiales bacterium]|nr:acylphosphatase [Burkholderiales bacterium]
MERVTRHLIITGRVQGVGYRFYMQRKARELGVAGWVRNRLDGSVEATVQGDMSAVEAMIAWARRGPPSAVVAEVQVEVGTGEFSGFETLPTE